MKCYRIDLSVSGDSKGFRFEVLQKALKSGITGYAMRTGVNDFQIVSQGEEEVLNEFLNWLEGGFHWTRITDGKMDEIPLEDFSTFEMRKSSNPLATNDLPTAEDEEEDDQVRGGIFSWFKKPSRKRG